MGIRQFFSTALTRIGATVSSFTLLIIIEYSSKFNYLNFVSITSLAIIFIALYLQKEFIYSLETRKFNTIHLLIGGLPPLMYVLFNRDRSALELFAAYYYIASSELINHLMLVDADRIKIFVATILRIISIILAVFLAGDVANLLLLVALTNVLICLFLYSNLLEFKLTRIRFAVHNVVLFGSVLIFQYERFYLSDKNLLSSEQMFFFDLIFLLLGFIGSFTFFHLKRYSDDKFIELISSPIRYYIILLILPFFMTDNKVVIVGISALLYTIRAYFYDVNFHRLKTGSLSYGLLAAAFLTAVSYAMFPDHFWAIFIVSKYLLMMSYIVTTKKGKNAKIVL